MIEIQFSTPHRQQDALEWEVVATLHVDGTTFSVDGDQDFAEVRDITVLDVDSGQTVSFDGDPMRWARNLPQAFRSGDIACRVVSDTAAGSVSAALAAGA